MLLENASEWKYPYIDQGRELGIIQGIAQGKEQGIKQILQILLEARWGRLPEVVASYIANSDTNALISFARFANQAPSMQAITDCIDGMQVQS